MARCRASMIAAALLLPLFGCGFPGGDYADLPGPGVIPLRTTVTDVAVRDPARPGPGERAALAAALAAAGPTGVRVQILLPPGAAVPDADALHEMTARLGIAPGTAGIAAVRSPGPGALVRVIRIEAGAPDCADLVTPNIALDAARRPSISLGCATYANLAAQVADPADLVQPRDFGGADGAATAAAVNRYQGDKVKTPPALGVSRIGTTGGGSSQ